MLYCWPVRYALISTNIFLIGISPNVLIAERDRETSMVRIPSARPHFLLIAVCNSESLVYSADSVHPSVRKKGEALLSPA